MPAVYFEPLSIAFVHVPRTAGTSIGAWLMSQAPNIPHWFDHPTLAQIKQSHDVKFSFAVVRNPWERMVSMYHHITNAAANGIAGQAHMRELLLNSNQGYFRNTVSFDQFVQDLPQLTIPKGLFRTDYPMASTQVDHVQGVDLVLKHETLTQDFVAIQQMVNNYTPLPVFNDSAHEHYTSYYDSTSRSRIEAIFGDDIEQWKYQF